MRKEIKKINHSVSLIQDTTSGLVVAEDKKTGLIWSAHPVINPASIPEDMKRLGYWEKEDRIVQFENAFINIDKLDKDAPHVKLLNQLCRCSFPYHIKKN